MPIGDVRPTVPTDQTQLSRREDEAENPSIEKTKSTLPGQEAALTENTAKKIKLADTSLDGAPPNERATSTLKSTPGDQTVDEQTSAATFPATSTPSLTTAAAVRKYS